MEKINRIYYVSAGLTNFIEFCVKIAVAIEIICDLTLCNEWKFRWLLFSMLFIMCMLLQQNVKIINHWLRLETKEKRPQKETVTFLFNKQMVGVVFFFDDNTV